MELDAITKTENESDITEVGKSIRGMKEGSNRLSEEIVYLPEQSIQRVKRNVNAETVEAKDNFINETLEKEGISFSKYIRMQDERRNSDTSSDLIKVFDESAPQRTKRVDFDKQESGGKFTHETVFRGVIVTRTLRGKKQRPGSSAQLIRVTETNLPEMGTPKGAIPKRRNIGSKSTISSPKAKAKSLQRTRGRNMKDEDTENGDVDNSSAKIKDKQEIVNKVTARGKKQITNRKLKKNSEKRTPLTVINLNYEDVDAENNLTSKPNAKGFAGAQKGIKQNSGISSEQFYLPKKKPSLRTRRNDTKKKQTVESENLCKENSVPKVRVPRVKIQNTNRLSQEQINISKDKAPQRRKRKNMKNEEVILSEANKNNGIDNGNTKSKPENKQNSKTENVTLPKKTRKRKTVTSPLGKIPGNSQNLWDTSPPLAVRRGRRTTATTVSYCY